MAAVSIQALFSQKVFPDARVYVAEGDSITANPPAASGGYADAAAFLASPAIGTFHNYAVSGASLSTMSASGRVNAVTAAFDPDAANILSVLIGANDLGTVNVNTWLADLASYCDARREQGWYVILCTILPQAGGTFSTRRAIANAEMRLWTTSGSIVPGRHADAICDFAADPEMGIDAAYSTGFFDDGLHPSLIGQRRMRDIFRPVLDAAMSNIVTTPSYTGATRFESDTGAPDTVVQLRSDRGVYWEILAGDPELTLTSLAELKLADAAEAGSYTATLQMTDGKGATAEQEVTWVVTDPPEGFGPNLVKNGNAHNGVFHWGTYHPLKYTISGDRLAAVDDGDGGQEFLFTAVHSAYPQDAQSVAVQSGHNYRLTATARLGTSPGPAFIGIGGVSNATTTSPTDVTLTINFTASSSSVGVIVGILQNPTSGNVYLDNIALREVFNQP